MPCVRRIVFESDEIIPAVEKISLNQSLHTLVVTANALLS